MATTTSSRNRSQRRSRKPVTTSKGRANRSSVSQAKVTNSGGGTPGSAKVTQGQGGQRGSGASPSTKPAAKPSVQTKPVTRSGPVKGPVPPKGNSAVKMPNSAKAGINLPKVGARAERTGARAAAAKPAPKPTPQARRGQGLSIGGGKLGAAAAGLQAYNTGDGTLTAAKKRGDLNQRRQPSPQEKSQANREAQTAKAKNAQRKGPSFDDAFRDARRAKAKTFTWNGKQYTTETK